MAAITDRSANEPLLRLSRLNHGTLECVDIVRTRRFYEEVLGLEVIQSSLRSMMIRKDTQHVYAVVETGRATDMPMLNHNGFEVGSVAEAEAAYEILTKVRDEYGIRKIQKPHHSHGDTSFYFQDMDGNWWEIVAVRPGGYVRDFEEQDYDLTGRHEFDGLSGNINFLHTHDPEFHARLTGPAT